MLKTRAPIARIGRRGIGRSRRGSGARAAAAAVGEEEEDDDDDEAAALRDWLPRRVSAPRCPAKGSPDKLLARGFGS